jgi:hypothetical protein
MARPIKVADWISAQEIGDRGMRWSVLTSCMYLETFVSMLAPAHETIDRDEVAVFKAPVGGNSAAHLLAGFGEVCEMDD